MRLRTTLAAVAICSALLLTACQPRRPAPKPPIPRPPVGVVVTPLAPSAYLAMAASVDLFEVKSSQLAQSRASNGQLRAVAAMLLNAHEGTAAQLSYAGRRLNLLPSATLLPVHQSMLDELAASANFDATWRRQQVEVHRVAVKLHGDFATHGASPTLRPVAASAVRIERAHLDRLRGL